MKYCLALLMGMIIMTVTWAEELAAKAKPVSFKKVVINDQSKFEAGGIADFNKDGKLDIFSGGFWYEAPDWKKHLVRELTEQDEYYVDFANLPFDVDGDGWIDIVNAAWHNRMVFWERNPGAADKPWEVIEVDQPGNMETALAVDVNGDGRLDILPNVAGPASAWYEFHPDSGAPHGARWDKHPLPPQSAGHGIGAGDVDGDGKCDIVTTTGWLQQTGQGEEPWKFCAEFNLGSASIPVLVWDVNGDKLADVVWGNAHDYGLFWLKQGKDAEGKRTWSRQEIDKSWSQVHYLLLADLDNDGKQELITGKRFRAHNDHDPGTTDPICVYYYSYDAATDKWTRQTITEKDGVGLGINTVAIDIDKDGDIDLLCPGKSGLYLMVNQLK